jgi:ribosomal-protein-alanine N-acetyltransferase
VTPVIRPVNPTDIAVVTEIEQESFGRPHWGADDFLRYDGSVALLEGRIVGFLISRQTLAPVGGIPAEREILNVAVLPAYRRVGIASALLHEELSHDAVFFLEVRESNVAARELYRRHGFGEIGRRKNYYQYPPETAIVMRMKRR